MSDTPWTPGPWEAQDRTWKGEAPPQAPPGWKPQTLWRVGPVGGKLFFGKFTEADARLIAAAPEMADLIGDLLIDIELLNEAAESGEKVRVGTAWRAIGETTTQAHALLERIRLASTQNITP